MILDIVWYVALIVTLIGWTGITWYQHQRQKASKQFYAGKIDGGVAFAKHHKILKQSSKFNWLALIGSGVMLVVIFIKLI